jgi:hypothetical protein
MRRALVVIGWTWALVWGLPALLLDLWRCYGP